MGPIRVVRNEESEPRISQISRMRRGKYPPSKIRGIGEIYGSNSCHVCVLEGDIMPDLLEPERGWDAFAASSLTRSG